MSRGRSPWLSPAAIPCLKATASCRQKTFDAGQINVYAAVGSYSGFRAFSGDPLACPCKRRGRISSSARRFGAESALNGRLPAQLRSRPHNSSIPGFEVCHHLCSRCQPGQQTGPDRVGCVASLRALSRSSMATLTSACTAPVASRTLIPRPVPHFRTTLDQTGSSLTPASVTRAKRPGRKLRHPGHCRR